ncbi:neural cell adhesion molecule 1-like [Dermacentor andersoni]|uniref:neural cell adhesion molecule 1-like n=1 Tax=Dermacentor andersoni TaxID=34620 RepID=UPI00241811E1|nr:hemicentin-2-like [Dermacentor andersoni]
MIDTRPRLSAWILRWALTCLALRGPRPGIAFEDAIVGPSAVTSRVGGDAALPCHLRHVTQDSWAMSVSWFKRGLSGPVYTIDMGSGNFLQARHRPAHLWAGRAYFSSADEPALLMIGDVAAVDAGLYVCSALFPDGGERNSTVRFVVVVPPETPVIRDRFGNKVGKVAGPYREGESLTLTCEVSGGVPEPTVTWWRNSTKQLHHTVDSSSPGVTRSTMELAQLHRHDLNVSFVCKASNHNETYVVTSSVTIDLYLKPSMVRIRSKQRPLAAGLPAEIECEAAGSRPAPVITWWCGKAKISADNIKVMPIGNRVFSVATYTPRREDNGKRLRCVAENPGIAGSFLEASYSLDVHYKPIVTLQLGKRLRLEEIFEGQDVYLECSIDANPRVSEVVWRFEDSHEVHSNPAAKVITSNQSLVFQAIQRLNAGRYTCVAANSEGESVSNELHLRVQYSPVCSIRQRVVYPAAAHEMLQVSCEVDAHPSAVSFQWAFNGSLRNHELQSFVSEGSHSVASYVPRDRSDYGILLCWATNKIGRQKEPCRFQIVQIGPPKAPYNCTLSNQTEDAFLAECLEDASDGGGLHQLYSLEVHDVSCHRLLANLSAERPAFWVQDVPAGLSYVLVLYAVNEVGRSQPVLLRAETPYRYWDGTLHHGGDWSSCEPSNSLAVILITVTFSAIFFLLLFVTLARCRTKKQRLKANTGDKVVQNGITSPRACGGSVDMTTFHSGEGNELHSTTLEASPVKPPIHADYITNVNNHTPYFCRQKIVDF